MFKTLLLGFGNISANYANDDKMSKWFPYSTHIQVLKEHPNFEIRAVIEPKEKARINASRKWEIAEVYENLDQLKDPDSYEVAVLAIPPKDRLDTIIKLTNLKAIIIEKPLATNIEEATEIINICNKRGILGFVNFPRRYDEKMIQHLINLDAQCGERQGAFGVYGNGLNNNGSHLIDWSRMFLGEVSWVQSICNGKSFAQGPIDGDMNFPFVIGFDSDIILFSQPLNFNYYREVSLDIWGSKGRLSFIQEGLLSSFNTVAEHRFSKSNKEIKNDKQILNLMNQGNAIYNLYDEVRDVLKSDKRIIKSDLNNALKVLKIIKSLEYSFFNNDQKLKIK